ncbi:MAG: hypothetical protein IPG96_19015 [Proteobacteria bacterium]|nr:hypothetical protein [Pseudomonadota bacterium]
MCSAAGACGTANAADGTSCPDEGKNCTKDLCETGSCTHTELEANTCLIGGTTCVPSGDRTTNTCQACVPATSTSAWTNKTVGASCTMSGTGDAGRCDGSTPPPDCCAGCLDGGNTCRAGTTVTWCGKEGANCAACTGAGECKVNNCIAGACGIADAGNGTACADEVPAWSCTEDKCASGAAPTRSRDQYLPDQRRLLRGRRRQSDQLVRGVPWDEQDDLDKQERPGRPRARAVHATPAGRVAPAA